MKRFFLFHQPSFIHRIGQILAAIALISVSHIALCEQTAAEGTVRNPAWATPVDTERNLFRITPNLYRSEQIDKNMIGALQKLEIRTVVNLRTRNEDPKVLGKSGIRGINIPMNTWDIEDKDVIAALRAIHKAEKLGAVLLHCMHGADRTGVVSAMYRIIYQGWSREQAIAELRHGGYGFHGIWINIPQYLERVDLEKIRKGVNRP